MVEAKVRLSYLAALALTLSLSVLGSLFTGQWAEGTPSTPGAAPRATVDCPDDSNLPQIHLLYAIPSDGPDQELDKKGLIQASVAFAQAWLAQQSGGSRLRFDTCQGELDVTFVKLPRTEKEYSAFGDYLPQQLEYDLWSAGFSAPNKLYAAYYSGRLERCGQAPYPSAEPGNLVVLAPKTIHCPEPFPASIPPGDWEFTLVHEVFHALGAVSKTAPNHCPESKCAPGHVNVDQGNPHDLMWAPDWKFPSILDVGKDDYWGHSDATRVDVSKSEFLEPTPAGSVPPPNWPLHVAASVPVSQEPSLRSPSSSETATLQIVNRSSDVIHIYWLDHSGVRESFGTIPANENKVLPTLRGHLWIVADCAGKALAIYKAPDQGWGRAVHVAP